jgi:hypothetical protein
MNHRRARQPAGTFKRAIVASVVVHLLLVIAGIKLAGRQVDEAVEKPEQVIEITAILDDDVEPPLLPPIVEQDPSLPPVEQEVAEVLEVELPPEPDQEEKPEAEPIEDIGQVVEQVTNQEVPDVAEFVSDHANKVEEETVAEEVVEEDVELAVDTPEEIQAEESEQEPLERAEEIPAPAPPEPTPRVEPVPSADEMFASQPAPIEELFVAEEAAPARAQAPSSPASLFRPQAQAYAELFEGADDLLRDTLDDDPGGRKFLQHWKDNEAAMRASLENFIYHVKPGNHTGVNAHPSAYASYVARIHRRIHQRWAHGFIDHATNNLPQTHPLNNLSLNTLMELVIDAQSGVVEQTNIVRSSGETTFDAEAIITVRSLGRHPDPPQQIVSRDGKVYIHWNFWRDSRQCGPFGAKIYLLNN